MLLKSDQLLKLAALRACQPAHFLLALDTGDGIVAFCVFRSDWWPVGFTAAVGFTNGHLQSLIFMHSPQALPRRARDRCGPIINFALCIGCTIGSVVSFALIASLQQR